MHVTAVRIQILMCNRVQLYTTPKDQAERSSDQACSSPQNLRNMLSTKNSDPWSEKQVKNPILNAQIAIEAHYEQQSGEKGLPNGLPLQGFVNFPQFYLDTSQPDDQNTILVVL